jgi:hypothetical protein
MHFAFAALVALAAQSAQGPRTVTLDKPDAILDVDFTQIRGVRELRDGRVLISDRLDRGVVVATFGTNDVKPISRTGRGPSEYRLPTSLIPLPGDSTLLYDEGNSRLAIIGPDLRIHRSFTTMLPGMGTPMFSRVIDVRGRHYMTIPSWMLAEGRGGLPRDTLPLIRFDAAANRVDTITRIKGMSNRAPGPRLVPGVPFIVFAPQDVWTVNVAGRIAIVRSADYHVEFLEPDGRVVRGPRVAYQPLPVTQDDKIDYMRTFMQNSNTSGRDPDGGMSATPAEHTSDENVRKIVAGNEFALTKPAAKDVSPLMSPEGTLWVERWVSRGDLPMWDVFDSAGTIIARVRLPKGQRVAALGAGTAYVIVTDDDGLQKLVRYRRERGL